MFRERTMDSIIRKLYCSMLKEDGREDKISQETQDEAMGLLKNLEKQIGGKEYAECYDGILMVASAAEENGFVEGFKYAFHLFTECIHG